MRDKFYSWGSSCLNQDYFQLKVVVPVTKVANFENVHGVSKEYNRVDQLFETTNQQKL